MTRRRPRTLGRGATGYGEHSDRSRSRGSDPVPEGWAKTFTRSAGIITGPSVTFPELAQKRLEIMKELLPGASRIAIVPTPAIWFRPQT